MSDPVEFSYSDFLLKPSADELFLSLVLIPLTILYKDRFVQYQAYWMPELITMFFMLTSDYLGIT
jgi:hypothetical protein